jgi:hypothetical protein
MVDCAVSANAEFKTPSNGMPNKQLNPREEVISLFLIGMKLK